MGAPSSRALALGAAFLLLLVALPSAFLYLTSSAAPAATRATLLNLKPFSARCAPAAAAAAPLRVFMYDLPARFHVAMMGADAAAAGAGFPAWPPSAGGIRRQHSVEYWMMASLLDEAAGPEEGGREAVRVRDPDAADAFFVPFFSSLSFNVHGRNMTDPDTEADRLLQMSSLKLWTFYGSLNIGNGLGRDHVIPMHHPNAFRFPRAMVNASILIVSDFGRYTKELASLRKDVVAPYVHVVDSFLDDDPPDPFEARHTLLFFFGRTVRKDEGKIRAKLGKILKGKEGSRIELPFEDEIDYSEFSLFFSVEEALRPDYLLNQLRQIPKKKWVDMWLKLKNISHHYEFQYPPRKGDAVNMIWRQVRHKIPAVNLAIHRNRRLKIPDWWG
ncbi:unnamed protein product [Miscanthus lutarioriparius]|uniref:Exostosin GT47 domain-containing protein n=1 Tax=Miscanthus lutarioriparius TaxID=422564 RepID=A0A811NW35_9POAL|nr:unnamed protein product [Miscanthus lutarioriparius]